MFDSMKIKMKTKKQLKQNEHVWQNIDMKMQMKNNETGIQMKKKIKRTQKNLQKRPLPLNPCVPSQRTGKWLCRTSRLGVFESIWFHCS